MTRLANLLGASAPYVTDGGIETDLIFNRGFELPHFASFVLLDTTEGRAGLRSYFEPFLALAERDGRGFILDTTSWRANVGWAAKFGMDAQAVRDLNRRCVRFAKEIRSGSAWSDRILVNGCIGPGGDGYAPDQLFSPFEAEELHRPQLQGLADEGVDLATALTMTHVGEAIGVVHAAKAAGVPIAISFTVETDGRLPVGTPLGEAIAAVEDATDAAPVYYGINCAHPTHFLDDLSGDWAGRIGVVRANASTLSHAELDEAAELDDGDPMDFGRLYGLLADVLPNLRVIGGCCGTDHRHVDEAMRRV